MSPTAENSSLAAPNGSVLIVAAGLVCQSWAVAKGDLSYDEARRRLAAHPSEGASMRQLRRQALRLSPGSLPSMVDVLARGSGAEVNGAFNVLYQHGARIDPEGGSPQSCRGPGSPASLSGDTPNDGFECARSRVIACRAAGTGTLATGRVVERRDEKAVTFAVSDAGRPSATRVGCRSRRGVH